MILRIPATLWIGSPTGDISQSQTGPGWMEWARGGFCLVFPSPTVTGACFSPALGRGFL